MEKPDLSKIVGKVNDSASAAGEKISEYTGKASQFIQNQVKRPRDKNEKGSYESQGTEEEEQNQEQEQEQEQSKDGKNVIDSKLHEAVINYNDAYTTMDNNGNNLFVLRTRSADLISNIEFLVNSVANRPKSFDADITEIHVNRSHFADTCEYAKSELERAKKSALGAGVGITAGTAIVSVAPTAAMWIATTFGTASTGTAISTLSGAAATNAALAWLGGGALAAGGGGMAAGSALLAMAGPLGWSIAGVSLLTTITIFTVNKVKATKQKREEIEEVQKNTFEVRMLSEKIKSLVDRTAALRDSLNEMYRNLLHQFGVDFMNLSIDEQLAWGTLVNNTKALAASLGESVQ